MPRVGHPDTVADDVRLGLVHQDDAETTNPQAVACGETRNSV